MEMMKEVVGDDEGGAADTPLSNGTASSDTIRLGRYFAVHEAFFLAVEAQLKRCLSNKRQ